MRRARQSPSGEAGGSQKRTVFKRRDQIYTREVQSIAGEREEREKFCCNELINYAVRIGVLETYNKPSSKHIDNEDEHFKKVSALLELDALKSEQL